VSAGLVVNRGYSVVDAALAPLSSRSARRDNAPSTLFCELRANAPDVTQPSTDDAASGSASTVLRAVAVLGAVGAVGAAALGGSDALGTFVDVLIPAVVLISLGVLAGQYERAN